MKISTDMLSREKGGDLKEPSQNALKSAEDCVWRLFSQKMGYDSTEIAKAVIPLISRNLATLKKPRDFAQMRKGVAIIGRVGTGKSILLKLAAHCFDEEYFNVPELAAEFSISGAESIWSKISPKCAIKDFILDDLGAEQESKHFGNEVPIIDIIYDRYAKWQNFGSRTWIASNLTSAQMEKRYGTRVVDRLREMCEIIPATGESMRGKINKKRRNNGIC